MATAELGKLENVPVRDVWQDEALDFTPWLAENLDLLGEVLHLDLERVQEEAQTGDFPLDIQARDQSSGALVAIENQLERTDHDHLGKILTYAGEHNARILIWVTSNFREEHRAALYWLNRWTREEIEIYGVEVRVVKISNSKRAPVFVPVSLPNAWSKRETKYEVLTPIAIKRQEFFQPLVDDLRKADFTDRYQALASTVHPFPSGVSDINYVASLEHGRKVWVYIPGWPSRNNQILNGIRDDAEKRAKVEAELALPPGTCIVWRTAAGSLGVYRDGSIHDSEEELEEIRKWMFRYLLKFKKVFNSRMEKIISEMDDASG